MKRLLLSILLLVMATSLAFGETKSENEWFQKQVDKINSYDHTESGVDMAYFDMIFLDRKVAQMETIPDSVKDILLSLQVEEEELGGSKIRIISRFIDYEPAKD